MKCILKVPNPALVFILQYLGNTPEEFLFLLEINKEFYDRFNVQDFELWNMIAQSHFIDLPVNKRISNGSSLSLRSKSNYKRLFLQTYRKKLKEVVEKNDYLILLGKELLEKKFDKPNQLKKLILTTFPKLLHFKPNWKCLSLEDNSLLTLSARYCHLKCMKLMVETFHSDVNLADMGGFSTLILCSFHGFMEGVQFAIQHGADIYLKGKLRSGVALTAEHWAAVRGHYHIFDYLRSIRLRDQKKRLSQLTQQKSSVQDESITSPQDDTLNDKNERNHINTASFNYDNATFEEIFLVGNNPTLENIDDKLPKNSINLVAVVPDGINNVATKKNVPFPSSSSSGSAPCDGSFCICGRGFVGNMVACDMADCPIEWYHFECVGLTKEPTGEWICPACRGESFAQPDLRTFNGDSKPSQRKLKKRKSRGSSIPEDVDDVADVKEIVHSSSSPPLSAVIPPSTTEDSSEILNSDAAFHQASSSSTTNQSMNDAALSYIEGSLCICGQGFQGKMIGCDHDGCDIEWYHFKCVGLTKEPGGLWYCPRCIGKASQFSSVDPSLLLETALSSPSKRKRMKT